MIDQASLFNKTFDEIEEIRRQHLEILNKLDITITVINSPVGDKIIKGLKADLDAVLRKYAAIKGTTDERLIALAYNQGRESQIREELIVYENSKNEKKRLTDFLDMLNVVIEKKKKALSLQR
jgi:hypothetical protein